jgi:hypothetical protein
MKKNLLAEELFRIHEMMGFTENQLDLFADTEEVEETTPEEEVVEDELIGKKVMVYYNLHKHTFSITHNGLVKMYADYVKLSDVTFKVREGGKEKVRDEKRKNVHAFVIGTLVDYKEYPSEDLPTASSSKVITYDPYKYDSFVYKDGSEPIYNAKEIEMINQPSNKIFQINEIVSLNEEGISYQPEKIDEFIVEVKKDIEMGRSLLSNYTSLVVNASLISVFEDMDQMKAATDKMRESEKYLSKKFDKFYDITQLYDYMDFPDNVKELDDVSGELDKLAMSISDLYYGLEDLIELVDKLSENNKNFFK